MTVRLIDALRRERQEAERGVRSRCSLDKVGTLRNATPTPCSRLSSSRTSWGVSMYVLAVHTISHRPRTRHRARRLDAAEAGLGAAEVTGRCLLLGARRYSAPVDSAAFPSSSVLMRPPCSWFAGGEGQAKANVGWCPRCRNPALEIERGPQGQPGRAGRSLHAGLQGTLVAPRMHPRGTTVLVAVSAHCAQKPLLMPQDTIADADTPRSRFALYHAAMDEAHDSQAARR